MMTMLIIGLIALLLGYLFYSRFIESIVKPFRETTPAYSRQDGMDNVPMSKWKNQLIQLLKTARRKAYSLVTALPAMFMMMVSITFILFSSQTRTGLRVLDLHRIRDNIHHGYCVHQGRAPRAGCCGNERMTGCASIQS